MGIDMYLETEDDAKAINRMNFTFDYHLDQRTDNNQMTGDLFL